MMTFRESWEQYPQAKFGEYSLAELHTLFGQRILHGIHERDNYSHDALHYAIENQRVDNVEFLVANGAYVNNERLKHVTRLFHFSRFQNAERRARCEEIFEILLAAGANPLAHYPGEPSLLTAAVGTPLFQRCLQLCNSVALERDDYGDTALTWAFIMSDLDAVIALKDLGDRTLCKSPAAAHNCPELAVEKIDSGATADCVWLWDVDLGPPGTLVVLFLAGVDLRANQLRLLFNDAAEELQRSVGDQYVTHPGYRNRRIWRCDLKRLHRSFQVQLELVDYLSSENPLATPARAAIEDWSFHILERIAANACIALQNLRLPALITTMILQSMLEEWPRIADYHFDLLVTTVKHFHDDEWHVAKQRRLRKD